MKRTEQFEAKLDELIREFSDLSYSDLEASFEFYADMMARKEDAP